MVNNMLAFGDLKALRDYVVFLVVAAAEYQTKVPEVRLQLVVMGVLFVPDNANKRRHTGSRCDHQQVSGRLWKNEGRVLERVLDVNRVRQIAGLQHGFSLLCESTEAASPYDLIRNHSGLYFEHQRYDLRIDSRTRGYSEIARLIKLRRASERTPRID